MNWATDAIITASVFVTPLTLALGWKWAIEAFRENRTNWRNKASLVAVILVTIAVVCWPIMGATVPKINWSSRSAGDDYGRASTAIEHWHRVVLKFTAAGLLVSVFGKPRAILPIAFSAIGVSVFWIVSTAL